MTRTVVPDVLLPPLPPGVVIPNYVSEFVEEWEGGRITLVLIGKRGKEVGEYQLEPHPPLPLQPGVYRGKLTLSGPLPRIVSGYFRSRHGDHPGYLHPRDYPSIGKRDTLIVNWELEIWP